MTKDNVIGTLGVAIAELKKISAMIPTPIYWEDLNSVFLGVNNAGLQIIGVESDDFFIGKTPYDIYPYEMAHNIVEHNNEVMRTGQVLSQEESITRLNGEIRYFTAIKSPLYDDNGKIIGIIGTSIDITDRKKMEEMKIAQAVTEQANQAKNRFLSIVSHEIRGPIGNIVSAVDFISPDSKAKPEVKKKMIKDIDQEARKALAILKNTAHYIALDSKKFQQRKSSLYLPGFLIKLERQYARQIKKKPLTFTCRLTNPIDNVTFDFMHSLEILRIIIDNAIKFTQAGTITLSTSLRSPNYIRFTLQDTGPGIEKLHLDNIFKTSLNSELLKTEKSYVKTGLKLPLARRIAELAGGILTIESELGVGTTIYLDMPYLVVSLFKNGVNPLDNEVEEENLLTHTTEDFFPFSILLVEDDPTTTFLESEALKSLGCNVVCAATAFKAIEILNDQTFDLIFIDITLPDMTGVALVEAIKPMLPDTTQMVALTSHSNDEDHNYFLQHGMMTMLGKPLTRADFKGFFQGYLRMLDAEDE